MVEIRLPRLAERKEDLRFLNATLSNGCPPSTGNRSAASAPRVPDSVRAILLAGERAGTGKRARPCLHDVRRRYHRRAGPAGTFDSFRRSRQNRRRRPAAHGRSAQASCACGCWPRCTATMAEAARILGLHRATPVPPDRGVGSGGNRGPAEGLVAPGGVAYANLILRPSQFPPRSPTRMVRIPAGDRTQEFRHPSSYSQPDSIPGDPLSPNPTKTSPIQAYSTGYGFAANPGKPSS